MRAAKAMVLMVSLNEGGINADVVRHPMGGGEKRNVSEKWERLGKVNEAPTDG